MNIKFSPKKLWKSYKKRSQQQNKEANRNVESFEENINQFLNTLFIREELTENKLRRILGKTKDEIEELIGFTNNNGYIRTVFSSDGMLYKLSEDGLKYLLDYRKIATEEKYKFWIKWATISIASASIVQIVYFFTISSQTKDTIFGFISGSFELLETIINNYFWHLLGFFILIKVIDSLEKYWKSR